MGATLVGVNDPGDAQAVSAEIEGHGHIKTDLPLCADGAQSPTRRVFACIGGVPNTDWARDTPIVRDQVGYLVTGADLLEGGKPPKSWPLERPPFYLETSVPGSFAAADVRRNSIKQVASAVGEGAMAVAFVHRYLQETA